jgi:hypothetical protein
VEAIFRRGEANLPPFKETRLFARHGSGEGATRDLSAT